jgi:uroporphyrinogen III methyltransferase/synthase
MIRISPPATWAECDAAIGRLGEFDAVAFTSANGVGGFLGRLREMGRHPGGLEGMKIYAVGEKTAQALSGAGVRVDRVAVSFSGAGLVAALGADLRGAAVLLPRGDLAREEVFRGLRDAGARVTAVTVYATEKPAAEESPGLGARVRGGEFDVIAFASPSGAENFASLCGVSAAAPLPAKTKCAAIGTTTADALRALGLGVDILAGESTGPGLVRSIDEYYS